MEISCKVLHGVIQALAWSGRAELGDHGVLRGECGRPPSGYRRCCLTDGLHGGGKVVRARVEVLLQAVQAPAVGCDRKLGDGLPAAARSTSAICWAICGSR